MVGESACVFRRLRCTESTKLEPNINKATEWNKQARAQNTRARTPPWNFTILNAKISKHMLKQKKYNLMLFCVFYPKFNMNPTLEAAKT